MFKTQNVTKHIHRHIWSKIFLFVYVCVYVCISFMRNQQKRRWRMINWNRSRRRTSKFLSRVASSTQIHIMVPRSISNSVCCKIFTCCTSIISAMVIILDVMKIYMYIYEFDKEMNIVWIVWMPVYVIIFWYNFIIDQDDHKPK